MTRDPLYTIAAALARYHGLAYPTEGNLRIAHLLTMRYIVEPKITQRQIAAVFEVTTPRIAQLEERGLKLLRHPDVRRPLAREQFFARHERLWQAVYER